MKLKLNVLLAITDSLRVKFKNMVEDYAKFFSKSQGAFLGILNTYVPKEGAIDEPNKRKHLVVQTTVDEKIEYFIEESGEFIKALFNQEKTNAKGVATAILMVEGNDWGEFTSLELLRLKSLLESGELGKLESLIANIPVREDSIIWERSDAEEYQKRNIWQTKRLGGVSKSSEKEEYILVDPNLKETTKSYTPKTSVRTTVIEIGDYTTQNFSGQWSHRERAMAWKRRNDLLIAVIRALKECNDCEIVESSLSADKIFGYIFYGQKHIDVEMQEEIKK